MEICVEKSKIIVENPPRQIGFNVLKIIATFFICCIHLLNYGGIFYNASDKIALKLLFSFISVCVNVFVLISGYFLVNSKFSYKKIIKLWVQVFFYSVVTYIIACFFLKKYLSIEFSVKGLFYACIPILNSRYWFFTAYFILYLIFPFLNKILHNSSQISLVLLLIGLIILNFFSSNGFKVENIISIKHGYSIIWFIFLYLVAGYIRLYPLKTKKTIFVFLRIYAQLLLCGYYLYLSQIIYFLGY